MNGRKILIIVGVVICIAVLSLAYYVIKVRAQNEIVTTLGERLEERNVPVERIFVTSQIPFDIEIAIRSVDEDEEIEAVPVNMWNEYITGREAMLMEKSGFHLNSYAIAVIDKNGEVRTWGQSFPSDDKQPFPLGLSVLSNIETTQVIKGKLNMYGMTLDNINVTTDKGRHNDVQYVAMELSIQDIDEANSVFPKFFLGWSSFLRGINQDEGTRIAVCDIKVYDSQGNLLIRHITDLEMTSVMSWQSEMVTETWYSSPPPEMKDTPVSQVTNTPPTIKDTPTPDDRNGKSTQNPYP